MRKILLLPLLALSLYGVQNYKISAGAGIVDASSTEEAGYGEVFSEPVLIGNIKLTLLPDTYNISIGYGSSIGGSDFVGSSTNNVNRGSYSEDVSFSSLSIFPDFANTKIGSFGLSYSNFEDNKNLRNINQSNVVHILNKANDSKNPVANSGDANMVVDNDDSLGYQNEITKLTLNYTIPEISFLPTGLGFQVGKEEGKKFVVKSMFEVAVSADYDGTHGAIGILKDKSKIKDGFSLTKLQHIFSSYDANFYNYKTSSNEYIKGESQGFALELSYKTKILALDTIFSVFGEQVEDNFNNGFKRSYSLGGFQVEATF